MTVSRTSLSSTLGPLELWNPGTYVIPDGTFGPGEQTHRRLTVSSPWVRGRFATSIVADAQIAPLQVLVQSPTEVELDQRIAHLIDAMTQFTYTITFTQYGLGTNSWVCEQADYAVGPGGVIDNFGLLFFEQPVTFSVPRSPVNAFGRI